MVFCSDSFWNQTLSWDSDELRFTECFQDTLPLIPCGLFWILSLMWFTKITKSGNSFKTKESYLKKKTEGSSLFSVKFLSSFFLTCSLTISFALQLKNRIDNVQQSRDTSAIVYFTVIFSTMGMSMVLQILEKKKAVISSLIHVLLWFFLLLTLVPVNINELSSSDYNLPFLILNIPSVILLLVVQSFPDLSGHDPDTLAAAPPASVASHVSRIMFSWLGPIVWKGYWNPLTQADVPPSESNVDVRTNVEEFIMQWANHVKRNRIDFTKDGSTRKKLSILWPLLKAFGPNFLLGNFLALIFYSLKLAGPMNLKLLIGYLESEDEEEWKGYFYAVLLLATNFTARFVFQQYIWILVKVAIRVRSSLISSVLRKTLRLSNKARQRFTTGEITNFVSVDSQRIMDTISYMANLWGAPFQLVVGMALLYRELGVASLAGLAGLLLVMPANLAGSKIGGKIQEKQLKAKDKRIKLMNEVLAGIKVLKLYAWELPFMKKLNDIREKEAKCLKANALLWSLINFTFSLSPFLVTVGSFSAFVLIDPENNILTPQKVFVSISIFNIMRVPLVMFPLVLRETIKMMVSINRITEFLNAEELESNSRALKEESPNKSTKKGEDDSEVAVQVSNATFTWEKEDQPSLKDVSLAIPKGSLTAIVGAVGSGKSSLMSALLGDMRLVQGSCNVQGTIAYVPQQAWIQNMSLKDNILFSNQMSPKRYGNVIKACALAPDLKLLANGDATEIGENGINLSGGQKHRVSLGRAVYSDRDVYLLDDPLSAVDAHVGKHIFDNVISSGGILEAKTRVWVTNQASYLPQVDHIVVLKNGEVSIQGSYEELLRDSKEFYDFVQEHLATEKEEEEEETKDDDDDTNDKCSNNDATEVRKLARAETLVEEDGKLIDEESSSTGGVSMLVYMDFIRKVGLWIGLYLFIATTLELGIHAVGVLWLSDWSDEAADLEASDGKNPNDEAVFRLGVYCGISLGEAAFQISRDLLFFLNCAAASWVVHEVTLKSVMRSPMTFFDTNPMGRIVNRFSSDMDTMDNTIPMKMGDALWCFMEVVATIVMVSYATPVFLYALLPIMFLFVFIQRLYIVTSRQLKRLFSVSKSPIFSHFSETVTGATSIRAYNATKRFIRESEEKIQVNVDSFYLSMVSNRWMSFRMEVVSSSIIFLSAFFAVMYKDTLTPGLAALSVTYAMNITGAIVWMIRAVCDLENDSVSLERIFEYTKNEPEAPWTIEDNHSKKELLSVKGGKVEFQNYQTRYREGLDLVLKGLDMTVNPGEKVGICGRTGAGKSSLTLALFRIIEPCGGAIYIDEQDTSNLGLHDLRSQLTIIPQDPVLFSGSLRFNLDPLGNYSDDQLWKTLELSHLKEHMDANVPNGLDHDVSEGGGNFSVGQRQLICLARAMLRKTKILILDEATAAVDLETDQLIQATLREEFADCTVLTIAHRLNTILDSNRIAVLSDGQLVEMDEPTKLLDDPKSHFKAMANDAGIFEIK